MGWPTRVFWGLVVALAAASLVFAVGAEKRRNEAPEPSTEAKASQ